MDINHNEAEVERLTQLEPTMGRTTESELKTYVEEAVTILRRISAGELEDKWIPAETDDDSGEYHTPAWETFNAHWKRMPVLPPYHASILQEMWYTLESYDARRTEDEPLFGDVANWAGMQQKAGELADLLENAPFDWGRDSAFPDWINAPPGSFSSRIYDGRTSH